MSTPIPPTPPRFAKTNHAFHLMMSWTIVWPFTVWPSAIAWTFVSNWWKRRKYAKAMRRFHAAESRLTLPVVPHAIQPPAPPAPAYRAPLPVAPPLPQRPTVTPHPRVSRARPYARTPTRIAPDASRRPARHSASGGSWGGYSGGGYSDGGSSGGGGGGCD